jgi:hypothetical protein
MKRRTVRRGQPLVVFVVMLGGWTLARYAAWTLLGSDPFMHDPVAAGTPVPAVRQVHQAPQAAAQAPVVRFVEAAPLRGPTPQFAPMPSVTPMPHAVAPDPGLAPQPPVTTLSPAPPVAAEDKVVALGGHQLLWLAAVSRIPLPPEVAKAMSAVPASAISPAPPAPAKSKSSRWSGDSWVLLRDNSGPAGLAAIGGSYGASQAGAVLRFRLDTSSARKPSAYLRLTGALNGTREQEVALGLSARPIRRLPLVAMAEVRASRFTGGTRLRPAAAVVTELPPMNLPLKLRAEAYGQAGWVGGNGATGFVDGQLRIDRKLASVAGTELRAGGGIWGGAQKGASRLDVGPSANLSLRLGDTASARVSADWRFRVAGSAAPSSGPALTLSAGF